jgi:hypothetical protein
MNRVVGRSDHFVCNRSKVLLLFATILLIYGFCPPSNAAPKTIGPSGRERIDLIVVETTTFVPGALPTRFPQGSRLVRVAAKAQPIQSINLTADSFAAADPEPSFDAKKILFSAQSVKGEKWQVWEMNADGSSKRQITHCSQDCLRAAYLPGDEVVLTVATQEGEHLTTNLAVVRLDGSNLHPITFGRADFELETVLRDGRVLASASWPLSAEPKNAHSRILYTLRPDGAALDSLRCDHGSPAIRGEATELDDGTIVYVKTSFRGGDAASELAEIRPGALQESSIRTAASVYRSPAQLSPGTLVISYSHSPAGASTSNASLFAFNRITRTVGERLYTDPNVVTAQAVPLRAHPVPKKFWSILNLESSTGSLISLNSASSADEPTGRIPGAIVRVRVLQLDSANNSEVALGEAPVEADGSFFAEVPANRPVRFELLDAKGQVLRAERSWIWARPGEQRGCAGCHASKALAPENRWPLTLKRFDTPTHFDAQEHSAAAKVLVN